jgi:hypothetical protein
MVHMFPNTLDEIPNKWYKIEEACGHTLNWSDIKENFVQDFKFTPEEERLREATQQIKIFLEKLMPTMQKEKGKTTVDIGSTSTCHLISTENNKNTTTRRIDMENTSCPGQSFRWKSDHPVMQNYVKSILTINKEEKDDLEQPDFPESFTKVKEGE